MGHHWGKGRQRAQKHLHRLAERNADAADALVDAILARPAGAFSPGACPHKLTVHTEHGPVEVRCQIRGEHELRYLSPLHRHDEHTWT